MGIVIPLVFQHNLYLLTVKKKKKLRSSHGDFYGAKGTTKALSRF